MNFENLKQFAKKFTPKTTDDVLNETERQFLLNEATVQVATDSMALRKSIYFNVVAEQREYSFYDISQNFLGIDKEGVWWNNGNGYVEVRPKTEQYMKDKRPNWINNSSGSPNVYWTSGQGIKFDPKPDTSLSNGFLVYGFIKPETMSDNAHYPFHVEGYQNRELPNLSTLSWSIIDYYKVLVAQIIDKDLQTVTALEKLYRAKLDERMGKINLRLDVVYQKNTKLG